MCSFCTHPHRGKVPVQPLGTINSGLKCRVKVSACCTWSANETRQVTKEKKKERAGREEDGGGVGGHGVHLSQQIHQEYTFRQRSACRTPAESGQEYLTSRKDYTEPCKTQDQALSLWSGSTDSKTLDYQRTHPRKYQMVRTHTKETTWIQDLASPNHQ